MFLEANDLSKIKQIRSFAPFTVLLASATSSLLGVRFNTSGYAWKFAAPTFDCHDLGWFYPCFSPKGHKLGIHIPIFLETRCIEAWLAFSAPAWLQLLELVRKRPLWHPKGVEPWFQLPWPHWFWICEHWGWAQVYQSLSKSIRSQKMIQLHDPTSVCGWLGSF